MGIKLSDAMGYISQGYPLTGKAVRSLERQIAGYKAKIAKAEIKIGQIEWLLSKNQELKESEGGERDNGS